MNFEKFLEQEIDKECNKLINRFHIYHHNLHQEIERNTKRRRTVPKKQIKTPDYWNIHKGCNPFHVKKNRKSIALSISKKIATRSYTPFSAIEQKIPKKDGGERTVLIYQIADAVVSRIYYKRLLSKNKHRFSSFSYAYRDDRNVHFAIQDISIDLARNARHFIAEFDFSDFFGNISHEYLFNQFNKNGFLVSEEENFIIKSFLHLRNKGIPQGTSISLFLANLACWSLDFELEREGLKFARYADDTLIWSTDYQKICNAFNIISNFSEKAEIPINPKKSEGISLLIKKEYKSEFNMKSTKNHVDFLGYSISVESISFKDKTVLKIKKQISYLLYKNLIQPLKLNDTTLINIGLEKDYQLMIALMQVRRYIYGGLNKPQLLSYISGRSKKLDFKGVMSFFPLVNNRKQIQDLDGWFISSLYRSLQLRRKLLLNKGFHIPTNSLFYVKKENLVKTLDAIKYLNNSTYEVPRFGLILNALQKGIKDDGIASVLRKDLIDYDY